MNTDNNQNNNNSLFVTPVAGSVPVPNNGMQNNMTQVPAQEGAMQNVVVQNTQIPAGNVQSPAPQVNAQSMASPSMAAQTTAPASNAGGVQAASTASVQTAAAPSTAAPSQMPASPSTNYQAIQMPSAGVPVTPVPMSTMPPMGNEDVSVIKTVKHKTSYVGLFLVVVIIGIFIFNIDIMVEYYDRFIQSGSLTANNKSSDNLTGGFILIGEPASSMKVKNITFNNFKKDAESKITFNYSSMTSINDVSIFNLYIELYDSNKVLIYKEPFKTESGIERNVTSLYSLPADSGIYSVAMYARVEAVEEDTPSTISILCKKSDKNYEYKNTYNFTNNMLTSYEVSKTALNAVNNLAAEYELLKNTKGATLENNTLKYTENYTDPLATVLYSKGVSNNYVKQVEEAKEWVCE